ELGNAHRVSLDWRYKDAAPEKAHADLGAERLRQAKADYDAGRFGAAALEFTRLAEERPESFGMQTAAAMSWLKLGDKASALKYFKRADSLKPGRKDLADWIRQAEAP